MIRDTKTLIAQLRDPLRVFRDPADHEAARKVANLLEHAETGKTPLSTLELLRTAAVDLLGTSNVPGN